MFEWPVRVYYEDTDALGLVYYANYLRFMERARTEWLRALGFEQDKLIALGKGFVVVSVQADYKTSARFNDELQVVTRIAKSSKASLLFSQEIYRGTDELLVKGNVKVCCIDLNVHKPCAIPPQLLKEMTSAG